MDREKKELRRAYRARGETLAEDYREAADRAICAAVLASEAWQRAESVFLFVSMWAEPDTGPLFAEAFRAGKRVYVPLCCPDRVMKAVRIQNLDVLRPGTYGIPEPPRDAETAKPGEPELAIVPCVSAAENGARLGHGAGYYDRFLPLCENAFTAAVAFEAQRAGTIPIMSWDRPVDAVVTEDGFRHP